MSCNSIGWVGGFLLAHLRYAFRPFFYNALVCMGWFLWINTKATLILILKIYKIILWNVKHDIFTNISI